MTQSADANNFVIQICLGNESAMQFCRVFLFWVHWVDDLIDQDKEYTPEQVIRLNLEAISVFSDNEFFQRNKITLTPLIVNAFGAFCDSLEWEKRESKRDRRAADVIKSFYHEVFWHTAYLCAAQSGKDGWAHMREMTKKFRVFDYDFKG